LDPREPRGSILPKTISARVVGRKRWWQQNNRFDSMAVHRAKRLRARWESGSSAMASDDVGVGINDWNGSVVLRFRYLRSEER
ncbi:MAG: hypothetical protein ACREQV_27075, partial [Candidatus Binatia bacterium]